MHTVTVIAFDILTLAILAFITALERRMARLERGIRPPAEPEAQTRPEALAERRFTEGLASILSYGAPGSGAERKDAVE